MRSIAGFRGAGKNHPSRSRKRWIRAEVFLTSPAKSGHFFEVFGPILLKKSASVSTAEKYVPEI
ncbi:hypothetical protein C1X69_13230 [Pseudomonas sp. FW305-67]|nr:hypothetical protein C1X68_13300 [Pseudomonas sp. FW303-C2]PNA42679.1 hypothetical protein C1X71_14335 [Pseudomonas sp. FW306-2-2C-A10BC]PNA85561.1 hypothetical protein C1X66_14995 [Pseudomonas sp. MPR-R3B]PNB20637.1 hypothetical protein C1X69_13230 [Pseudomonas sp. FW305-67]